MPYLGMVYFRQIRRSRAGMPSDCAAFAMPQLPELVACAQLPAIRSTSSYRTPARATGPAASVLRYRRAWAQIRRSRYRLFSALIWIKRNVGT